MNTRRAGLLDSSSHSTRFALKLDTVLEVRVVKGENEKIRSVEYTLLLPDAVAPLNGNDWPQQPLFFYSAVSITSHPVNLDAYVDSDTARAERGDSDSSFIEVLAAALTELRQEGQKEAAEEQQESAQAAASLPEPQGTPTPEPEPAAPAGTPEPSLSPEPSLLPEQEEQAPAESPSPASSAGPEP